MEKSATIEFVVVKWQEETISEVEGGPKLTRASIPETLYGDMTGEATSEYIMVHRSESSATFVKIQRLSGTLGGKEGTFVIQGGGVFDGETANGHFGIIADSGTGELSGITGEGEFSAKSGATGTIKMVYEI